MHAVKPLPFNASKLRGLSERLIEVNRRLESAQRRNE
jgi:hypothetical protein